MRPRIKAILLVWVCMLVQAVSVFPHHHHAEALCLGHGPEPVSPATPPQPCTASCITHFCLTLPAKETVGRDVKDVQREKDLSPATWAACCCQSRQDGHSRPGVRPMVSCSTPPEGGTGWRAPPCLC